jgi:branched-chain amino acid transport system ATP-binding protein
MRDAPHEANMLKVQDLHVYYGGIHALKGISIEVPKGKVVTLIGSNGAGKSSTLRAIAGLIKHKKGVVTFNGADLSNRDPVQIVKSGIVMAPEGRRIFPHLTVLENLRLGAYSRSDEVQIARDLDWIFELFPKMRDRKDQKGGTLSGGEQQMLALGRALMSAAEVVMLDEPSLGLAPMLVKEVFDIIGTINRQGKTVLLVEQNAFAALKIADYAYVLETGAIVLQGTGEELIADARVREAYLGG